MFDGFPGAVAATSSPPEVSVLVLRITLAMLCGFLVAGVHVLTLGRSREDSRTLPTTLVLLAVLVALITMVIGDSTARAFGLVGALSIVRFRSVVEDTRDTAFVIFAVAVGMAVGAGYAVLAAVGLPAVTIAAAIMARIDRPRANGQPLVVTVRLGLGHDPDTLLNGPFAKFLTGARLTAVSTAKQGTAVDYTFAGRLKGVTATALVADLNRLDGVQGIELKLTGQ
ncbi:MAG: DUF4956 domain-containing protein [Gemmataceae bacterium]